MQILRGPLTSPTSLHPPCHSVSDSYKVTTAFSPALNPALSLSCLLTMAAEPTRPTLLCVRPLNPLAPREIQNVT